MKQTSFKQLPSPPYSPLDISRREKIKSKHKSVEEDQLMRCIEALTIPKVQTNSKSQQEKNIHLRSATRTQFLDQQQSFSTHQLICASDAQKQKSSRQLTSHSGLQPSSSFHSNNSNSNTNQMNNSKSSNTPKQEYSLKNNPLQLKLHHHFQQNQANCSNQQQVFQERHPPNTTAHEKKSNQFHSNSTVYVTTRKSLSPSGNPIKPPPTSQQTITLPPKMKSKQKSSSQLGRSQSPTSYQIKPTQNSQLNKGNLSLNSQGQKQQYLKYLTYLSMTQKSQQSQNYSKQSIMCETSKISNQEPSKQFSQDPSKSQTLKIDKVQHDNIIFQISPKQSQVKNLKNMLSPSVLQQRKNQKNSYQNLQTNPAKQKTQSIPSTNKKSFNINHQYSQSRGDQSEFQVNSLKQHMVLFEHSKSVIEHSKSAMVHSSRMIEDPHESLILDLLNNPLFSINNEEQQHNQSKQIILDQQRNSIKQEAEEDQGISENEEKVEQNEIIDIQQDSDSLQIHDILETARDEKIQRIREFEDDPPSQFMEQKIIEESEQQNKGAETVQVGLQSPPLAQSIPSKGRSSTSPKANSLCFSESVRASSEMRNNYQQLTISDVESCFSHRSMEKQIQFPICIYHSLKKGKYVAEIEGQAQSICSKCAIKIAASGIKVFETEIAVKENSIRKFMKYMKVEVREKLENLENYLKERERDSVSFWNEQKSSIQKFFQDCENVLKDQEAKTLNRLQMQWINTHTSLQEKRRSVSSRIQDVESMKKDIQCNLEQILYTINIYPFHDIIYSYTSKCNEYLQELNNLKQQQQQQQQESSNISAQDLNQSNLLQELTKNLSQVFGIQDKCANQPEITHQLNIQNYNNLCFSFESKEKLAQKGLQSPDWYSPSIDESAKPLSSPFSRREEDLSDWSPSQCFQVQAEDATRQSQEDVQIKNLIIREKMNNVEICEDKISLKKLIKAANNSQFLEDASDWNKSIQQDITSEKCSDLNKQIYIYNEEMSSNNSAVSNSNQRSRQLPISYKVAKSNDLTLQGNLDSRTDASQFLPNFFTQSSTATNLISQSPILNMREDINNKYQQLSDTLGSDDKIQQIHCQSALNSERDCQKNLSIYKSDILPQFSTMTIQSIETQQTPHLGEYNLNLLESEGKSLINTKDLKNTFTLPKKSDSTRINSSIKSSGQSSEKKHFNLRQNLSSTLVPSTSPFTVFGEITNSQSITEGNEVLVGTKPNDTPLTSLHKYYSLCIQQEKEGI